MCVCVCGVCVCELTNIVLLFFAEIKPRLDPKTLSRYTHILYTHIVHTYIHTVYIHLCTIHLTCEFQLSCTVNARMNAMCCECV